MGFNMKVTDVVLSQNLSTMKKGIVTLVSWIMWGYTFAQLYVPEVKVEVTNGNRVGINTTNYKGVFNVSGGDVWLLESGSQTSGESVVIPGLAYLIPHSTGNVAYLQARRWDNSGTTQLRFRTYNNGSLTEAMHINQLGRVGIGMTNPGHHLEINDIQNTSAGANVAIALNGKRAVFGYSGSKGATYVRGFTKHVVFEAGFNNEERMRITRDGNVGIGTSTPSYKLQVMGSVASFGNVLTSDKRLKKDIQEYSSGLALVKQMNVKKYKYKAPVATSFSVDEVDDSLLEEGEKTPTQTTMDAVFQQDQIGVLAQEIQQIAPELVSSYLGEDGLDVLTVNQTALTFILINAVKEQQAFIEELQQKVQALEGKAPKR